MNFRRKLRNGIVQKVRKGAKCIAIMRIILWIGVMKSAGMCFFHAVAPDEYYEKRVTSEQLYAAMNALPEKQCHRIYAYYILKISQSEIARIDGVDHRTVNISIQRGLRNLERYLKNIF